MGNTCGKDSAPPTSISQIPSAVPSTMNVTQGEGNPDYPTVVVNAGHARDYKNYDMKEFEALPNFTIVVAKYGGKLHAFGGQCPHYGAPLVKGVLKDGMIKCPWHGACFDIRDGDIEEYPGNDCLPTYRVHTRGGNITVDVTNAGKIAIKKPFPDITRKTVVLIIGAGASGLTAGQVLREHGYDGRIIMISKDMYMPYDRTKLSKALGPAWEDVKTRGLAWYKNAAIEFMLKTTVKKVDVQNKECHIQGIDEPLTYDKLIVASGMKPRLPPSNQGGIIGTNLKGVHTLYELRDSHDIKESCTGKQVVIVGAGFIGMELIGPICQIAERVTILCRSRRPYSGVFGDQVARTMQHLVCRRHKDKLVFLSCESVRKIEGSGKVEGVLTVKKRRIPCDVVIFAIGGVPNTEFVQPYELPSVHQEQSFSGDIDIPKMVTVNPLGMDSRGFLPVNEFMETCVDNHFACGDSVTFPLGLAVAPAVHIGHWGLAQKMGRTAALRLLEQADEERDSLVKTVPFFWHNLGGGTNIRYVGYGEFYDHALVFGNLKSLKFCVLFKRAWKVLAALTCGCDPIAARLTFDIQASTHFEVYPTYLTKVFPDPPIVGEDLAGIKFHQEKDIAEFDLREAMPKAKPKRRRLKRYSRQTDWDDLEYIPEGLLTDYEKAFYNNLFNTSAELKRHDLVASQHWNPALVRFPRLSQAYEATNFEFAKHIQAQVDRKRDFW